MSNEHDQSRIEIFEQMLASDPANTTVLFGLAKEYEKSGDDTKLIETLERYLAAADDEGNAFGMLARAYERSKQTDKAREAYRTRHRSRARAMVIQAWPKSTDRFWTAIIEMTQKSAETGYDETRLDRKSDYDRNS